MGPLVSNRTSLKRFGAALGIVLLLFITTVGLCHYHTNKAASDACQVCHVAHAPLTQAPSFSGLALPLFIGWTVFQPEQSIGLAAVLHEASPRAPPTA